MSHWLGACDTATVNHWTVLQDKNKTIVRMLRTVLSGGSYLQSYCKQLSEDQCRPYVAASNFKQTFENKEMSIRYIMKWHT